MFYLSRGLFNSGSDMKVLCGDYLLYDTWADHILLDILYFDVNLGVD